jgi:hypothetical protein
MACESNDDLRCYEPARWHSRVAGHTSSILDVPVRVVSLTRSSKRRRKIRREFAEHNITRFTFEDAIDGRSDLIEDAVKVDGRRLFRHRTLPIEVLLGETRGPRWWRPLNSTRVGAKEVACTLSHLSAICSAYVEGDAHVIVMEDDTSLEYLPHWEPGAMRKLLSSLDTSAGQCEPGERWAVAQLAMSFLPREAFRLARMAERHKHGQLVSMRNYYEDLELVPAVTEPLD